jgi:hypothetical protein
MSARQNTRTSGFLTLVCILVFWCARAVGQGVPGQQRVTPPPSQVQTPEVQIARERFDFERDLEYRKLRLEWVKAILTAIAIAAPLGFGFRSLKKQAQTSFELKAAELLLNSKTPGQLEAKAKVLLRMFAGRLPKDFQTAVGDFKSEEFSGPGQEWKLELFKALNSPQTTRQEVIEIWKKIFPNDSWIERLK